MAQDTLLSNRQLIFLYIGFATVYISGLFIPLMQNDSAQHATMAMRMALNNDFLNIYKGDNPYLDKPHMHFWLAAVSMKLFGINPVAYRIPALLCLALGAFSTKKLAELLYGNKNLGHTAALMFLSAQTVILSAHDVRTDAVLTGFVIFAIWQFVKFIKTQKLVFVILAGLGTAVAFSSKGLMTLVIISFSVFAYLLYSREWTRFFNFKIIAGAVSFAVGVSPMLYAYHHQFGVDGIKFILLGQSVARMTGEGFAATNSDYLFFFHTLLWAFLPFSLLFYVGVFDRTKFFITSKFKKTIGAEFLTLGAFWMVLLVFSFSKFKLPHYLNGLIPVLAIFTAAYLFHLYRNRENKKIKILWIIQLVVIFTSIMGLGLLITSFTGIPNIGMYMLTAVVFALLLYRIFGTENLFSKYAYVSVLFAIAVNLFLNTQFYPVLTQYQGSIKLAEYVNSHRLAKQNIYMLTNDEAWAFDFYTKQNTPRIEQTDLKPGNLVVVYDGALKDFKRPYEIVSSADNFRITKLSLKFLDPARRPGQLSKIYLIKIKG
ncbi:ArnT family glycosyltransferase [Chryseobacterium taklimakanense]|uniref:Glycosyltransferase family 39 protein n=1 Tax=Chryseobacterium taklimakanense TaxID=536441 RepID=A0A3G8WNG8_9FLAO|nr:glycosyltransferase family 39 protein [Chryseobacterium taklimakanense]AZI21027.1 glycosyltransferase family 39 protein [Chryseobacterium taklimakanense]